MNEALNLPCFPMRILNQDVVGLQGLYPKNSLVMVGLVESLILVRDGLGSIDRETFIASLQFLSETIRRLR